MNRDKLYQTLLTLLEATSPNPNERDIIGPLLPPGGMWDDEDNYILEVGKDSKTLFAAHIDTVGRVPKPTDPTYHKGFLFTGNNDADCLGGDDRCGVLCLLALIAERVPGTYIFHNCEEKGALGAHHIIKTFDLEKFNRAIEFDRRGTSSIITEMSFSKVCSVDFAKALAESLNEEVGFNYLSDPTGSYTDVYNYREIIPEVTNLSVGYYNEHSNKECISVLWLIDHLIPRIRRINWENLPTVRDPVKDTQEEEAFYRSRIYMGNFKYGKYFERGSSVLYNSDEVSSADLDKEFERKMLEDEEAWGSSAFDEVLGVGYKHKDSNYSDVFGVCDCCNDEAFVDSVDDYGKYLFCEDCNAMYEAALQDVDDYLQVVYELEFEEEEKEQTAQMVEIHE